MAIGPAAGGLRYADVRRLAAAAAPDLRSRTESVVAYAGANGPAVPVALFAAAWAGRSYAPINHRLPPAALAELAGRLGCQVAIGDAEHVSALAGAGVAHAYRADAWLGALAGAGGSETGFSDEPEHPAVLLFTSGTSAAPKAAVLDHSHLLAYLFNTGDFASAGEEEATLLAVPPFHVAGVVGVLSSIYAGRRIVPLDRFSPEGWLAAARREQVTHAFVVPTMLARVLPLMEADPDARVPSLRTLSYGGARMPLPVLERALGLFPDAGFVNAYGLTETSSTVALLGPDEHREAMASADAAVRARLGSVGRPITGVEVDIIDEQGRPLPSGERGRVRIRGPQVSGAYLGVAADDSGGLMTGDIGWVDAEGYLFLAGRADDVIIAGGENISPGEIEDALLRHPSVTGAAVVGVPDEEWGERVAAAVTVRADADVDADSLSAWARTELGGLKAPKTIVIESELPMTASGKIVRREIRERLGALNPR